MQAAPEPIADRRKPFVATCRGRPIHQLTASSVVFVTAHDATGGNSAPMPRIASTSFTLGRNGTFPVGYEIAVPAAGPKRIALAVEIRRAGAVIFSNDRGYSQTNRTNLDIPMREAPPKLKLAQDYERLIARVRARSRVSRMMREAVCGWLKASSISRTRVRAANSFAAVPPSSSLT